MASTTAGWNGIGWLEWDGIGWRVWDGIRWNGSNDGWEGINDGWTGIRRVGRRTGMAATRAGPGRHRRRAGSGSTTAGWRWMEIHAAEVKAAAKEKAFLDLFAAKRAILAEKVEAAKAAAKEKSPAAEVGVQGDEGR